MEMRLVGKLALPECLASKFLNAHQGLRLSPADKDTCFQDLIKTEFPDRKLMYKYLSPNLLLEGYLLLRAASHPQRQRRTLTSSEKLRESKTRHKAKTRTSMCSYSRTLPSQVISMPRTPA
jgi:hypothetical protein